MKGQLRARNPHIHPRGSLPGILGAPVRSWAEAALPWRPEAGRAGRGSS